MKKPLTKEEAFQKMAALCARSEQCEFDIALKLRKYGLSSGEIREIIDALTEQRFLDTSRFARSFARYKVRFCAWGKVKIRTAMFAKRIPERIIAEALAEIDVEDYADAVARAARSKAASLDMSSREDYMKLYRHLLSRGFESQVASAETKKYLPR